MADLVSGETMTYCPFALGIFEIEASLNCLDDGTISQRTEMGVSLINAISDWLVESSCLEYQKRTPVKIERGNRAGNAGTIAGCLADREGGRKHGLSKCIVLIGYEFHVVLLDDIRELSMQEQILLGFK